MTQETKEAVTTRQSTLIPEKNVAFCHDHIAGVTLGFNIDKDNRVVHVAASFCHKRAGKNSLNKIDDFSKTTGRLKVRGRLTSCIHAYERKAAKTFPFSYWVEIPDSYRDLRAVEKLVIQMFHKYVNVWREVLGLREGTKTIKPITYQDINFTTQAMCTNDEFFIDFSTALEESISNNVQPVEDKKESK